MNAAPAPATRPFSDPPAAGPPGGPGADREHLASWLSQRDVPCPVCSYNLRDLRSGICPECAAALHLQVGSDNLRLGPWLLAVVSLALALGFDGVVSILMTVGVTLNPPISPGEFQVVLTILGVFIALGGASLAGILILVRRRSRWNRLSRRAQWRLGAAVFAMVGGGHALYGVLLFAHLN